MPTRKPPLRQMLAEVFAQYLEDEIELGVDPDTEEIYGDSADSLRNLIDFWNAARPEDT